MTTTATTTPSVQVSYTFFFQRDRKSDTNVIRHYVQAPSSANMCFYTCSVPDVFQGISVWIRVRLTIILSTFFSLISFFFLPCLKNNLSTIVRKLKLIWQKLFGFRFMSPPTSAANIWTCSHLAFPILLKNYDTVVLFFFFFLLFFLISQYTFA